MFRNFIFVAILAIQSTINAQHNISTLDEEKNIYEKISNVPLKIVNRDDVRKFELLYKEKPVILALVFTQCSGICNPFLLQLKNSLQFIKTDKNYQILVLSFDSRDNLESMSKLAKRFELDNAINWKFAITDSIQALNNSVGFSPLWDSIRKQFDHEALLVGINQEGYIAKKLIGVRSHYDLELMIRSINHIYTPSYKLPAKNSLFSCFNYDPLTGKNTPGTGLLIIVLPAFITAIIILFVALISRTKRQSS